jgi:hypothetical protein
VTEDDIMGLVLMVIFFIALSVLAVRFGADSRPPA